MMKQDLVDKLNAIAPGVFQCTIDCGNGWFPILTNMKGY